MPTTVIPDLIDALVTASDAALGADTLVFDGFGITADPAEKMLMIGVDDVDSRDAAWAANAEQEWANANYTARDEQGHVMCAAAAWNGEGNAKTARDHAFAILAAVENLCRANPSLGLTYLLWTSVGTRISLSQNQHDGGAMAVVVFNITYRARI